MSCCDMSIKDTANSVTSKKNTKIIYVSLNNKIPCHANISSHSDDNYQQSNTKDFLKYDVF